MKLCKIILIICLASNWSTYAQKTYSADVIVYGGNASAIMAAVQVKKMGHSVIVVSPDKHLGGLTSGGLGFSDTGNKEVIGGLSREFYHRVYLHYRYALQQSTDRPDFHSSLSPHCPELGMKNF